MYKFEELLPIFNSSLESEIELIKNRKPFHLYQPVVYTLNMGGKRIRPVVVLMAYSLFGKNIEEAIPVALAVELFHNFTLLHDDIMDKSTLRRNKKTVHVEYTQNTAILSGDAMSILAYEYLSKSNANNLMYLYEYFTSTALKVCEGQQLDMDFENRNNVTVDEYLNMIGLKTAALLAESFRLGAVAGNANFEASELLYQFGFNLGMAFQLQDDLLDSFGNTAEFGKNIGGDIAANKKTYLMLKSLELASEETFNNLTELLQNKSIERHEKIERTISIYTQLDIPSHINTEINSYYQKALQCIESLELDYKKEKALTEFASKLMARKS